MKTLSILLLFLSLSFSQAQDYSTQIKTWHKNRIAKPWDVQFQKLNPFTNRYETVRRDSKLIYNGANNTWRYAPKNSKVQYDTLNRRHVVKPRSYRYKYNTLNQRHEKVRSDSRIGYNYYNKNRNGSRWKFIQPRDKLRYNIFKKRYEYPK